MASKHGIWAALQSYIARDSRFANFLVAALFAQPLELGVKIEDQRRILEASREARGVGMQSDHEEALTADAETEVRRIRVGVDVGVPAVGFGIYRVEGAQPLPKKRFEFALRKIGVVAIDDSLTDEHRLIDVVADGEFLQAFCHEAIVGIAANVRSHENFELVAPQRCLSAYAGEVRRGNKRPQFLGDLFSVGIRRGDNVGVWLHFLLLLCSSVVEERSSPNAGSRMGALTKWGAGWRLDDVQCLCCWVMGGRAPQAVAALQSSHASAPAHGEQRTLEAAISG